MKIKFLVLTILCFSNAIQSMSEHPNLNNTGSSTNITPPSSSSTIPKPVTNQTVESTKLPKKPFTTPRSAKAAVLVFAGYAISIFYRSPIGQDDLGAVCDAGINCLQKIKENGIISASKEYITKGSASVKKIVTSISGATKKPTHVSEGTTSTTPTGSNGNSSSDSAE